MGHLLGNSCSLSLQYALFVSCIFIVLVISNFGFEDRILVLFVSVPGHCLFLTFTKMVGKHSSNKV